VLSPTSLDMSKTPMAEHVRFLDLHPPLAARVIIDLLMPTVIALTLMASQRRGAALRHGLQHLPLGGRVTAP
jgi:hypothetical protein